MSKERRRAGPALFAATCGLLLTGLLATQSATAYPPAVGTMSQALSADEIVRKSHLAFYYPGKDAKMKITMNLIDKRGGKRKRVLTMLRRDDKEGGNQKYFIYFHEPSDVRRMTMLVWKYPEKNDDRWIFIPAVNLVRRIAARDSRSSFAGSDFTYEDVSGRDLGADKHTSKGEKTLEGKRCYLIESVPQSAAEYGRKLAWIDKQTFLPLKEEYYDRRGELYKVFTAGEVKKTGGLWTVTKRTMNNVKSGHRTEVTITDVRYDLGFPGDLFTERYLRNPPMRWIGG